MKSRISIEVGDDFKPIILIRYKHSDDVRDTLVGRFLELNMGSPVLEMNHVPSPTDYDKYVHVTTVPPNDLETLFQRAGRAGFSEKVFMFLGVLSTFYADINSVKVKKSENDVIIAVYGKQATPIPESDFNSLPVEKMKELAERVARQLS